MYFGGYAIPASSHLFLYDFPINSSSLFFIKADDFSLTSFFISGTVSISKVVNFAPSGSLNVLL